MLANGRLVGEEKVWVEAETEPGGDIVVLSLRDVRKRRRLMDKYGKHNVRLSTGQVERLGFPPNYMADLERGRPVQFKMYESAYEGMLGRGGLQGLGEDDDEGWISVIVSTQNWDLDDKVRSIAEKHGGEHTGSGTLIATGERDNSFSFDDMATAKRAAAALRRVKGVTDVEILDMREEDDYTLHGLDMSQAHQVGPFPYNVASRRAQQLMDHGASYVRLNRGKGGWVVSFVR